MANFFDSINPKLQAFIEAQKIFFTATAAAEGRINLSPKGLDSLRVVDPNRVVWLNLTGSGNETAAQLREVNRITLMFCSFEEKPLILRLYGSARTIHPKDGEWETLYQLFPDDNGARQIFDVSIESVQTSCGFAVPLMEFQQEREVLTDWSSKQGKKGIKAYWEKKNQVSIDGLPTGIFDNTVL